MDVLLSWSGGKDAALALARLREQPDVRVAGLITTMTTTRDRVSVHGVRRPLLHRQARALGLPLLEIELPPMPSNEQYRAAWRRALAAVPASLSAARTVAFGDIFLADVRAWRESLARELGLAALFPLWDQPTTVLAREVIDSGIAATVVCVDTDALPADMTGRRYDDAFLADLPDAVDPCGERGEFHTFVSAAPGFAAPVPFAVGDAVLREGRLAIRDLVDAGPQ